MARPLKFSNFTLQSVRLPFGKYLKAHHVSRAGFIAAACGAALLFFVVGAALRLLVGPVSLGPFGSALSNAIAEALPGITVKYDQAAIEWSRDEGRVNLVILGTRVFDPDGRIIAQAPKADIDLAARPFLQGKVEVRRITLVGVQLTLVRTRDGGLRLGVEKDSSGQDFLSNITDAITATNSKTSSLQSFAVHNARIALLDEVTGLFVVAPRADLKIETAGPNLAASLDADLEIGGRPAQVKASITLPPKKGPVSGDLTVTGLDIGALGASAKAFALVKGIALITDLSASFTIDHGAHLAAADFGLDAHGAVGLPGLIVGPVKIRSARIVGRYDGRVGRVLIDDGELVSDQATTHLTGSGTLGYDVNHVLSSVSADVVADSASLDMPGTFSERVSLRRLAFRGRYDIATRDFNIDHFGLSNGAMSGDVSGKVTLVDGQSPAIALKGSLSAMSVRDLLKIWPLTVGDGAREWISENMFAGSLGPITLDSHIPAGALDQPALPDGALAVIMPIRDAEANYVTGMTHLTKVNGVAKLTGDTFTADFNSARIGPLLVSRGHAVIADLHTPGAPGDVSAHVDGSMTEILVLLDQKPLNYPTRFGVSPTDTKGQAGLDLAFHIPMRKQLSVDDVGISVKAAVEGLDIALGPHSRLTNGTALFNIDNNRLHATGTASLSGSRVALDWNEDFKSKGPITTHITAKGMLDAGAREALGLGAGEYFKGPSQVDAVLTGRHGKVASADVTLDLTPAAIALDLIGIDKPTGMPANARIVAQFGPSATVRTAELKIATPGGTVAATASFAADGSLASLNIPVARFGAADDFSFSYSRSPSLTEVIVRGRSIDGSRILHREGTSTAASAGTGGPESSSTFQGPFHVVAKLDRVVLRDGISIAPFDLEASGISDRPQTLAMSGLVDHTGALAASITNSPTGRKLSFTTSDAGQLARGLLGLTGMRGGALELSANLPGRGADNAPKEATAPDFQGTLALREATLVNQPFVARLFMAASLAGIGNLLAGQGITISKIEVPFSSKNGVISVHDAIASGPTIGATADGYIDRPKNAVALKGSLVPVVGLDFNRVLGAIPVVGDILVSKKGEGIFGVTYSVRGDADEPSLTVNPLSMLTPGIFRRIFEGQMPTAAQAPSNLIVPLPKPEPPPAPGGPASSAASAQAPAEKQSLAPAAGGNATPKPPQKP